MGYIEDKSTVTKKIKVLPCVKCGRDNIDIGDEGYSSFNVAWGKCKDCKHEVKIDSCSYGISKKEIAKVWNKANNPKILKAQYEKKIKELQKKIDELPK